MIHPFRFNPVLKPSNTISNINKKKNSNNKNSNTIYLSKHNTTQEQIDIGIFNLEKKFQDILHQNRLQQELMPKNFKDTPYPVISAAFCNEVTKWLEIYSLFTGISIVNNDLCIEQENKILDEFNSTARKWLKRIGFNTYLEDEFNRIKESSTNNYIRKIDKLNQLILKISDDNDMGIRPLSESIKEINYYLNNFANS